MSDAIETTIDSAGRIVIPKVVRQRAGLRPDVPVIVELRDGVVELRPRPRDVELVELDGVMVAIAREDGDALTVDGVDETRRALRTGRQ